MLFEYLPQEVFTKQLDLVDPGNSAVRCQDSAFNEYYILLKTTFGKTHILCYGPVLPDLGEIKEGFSLYYKKIDYNEQKIEREINLLLQNEKKAIVEAEEIPVEIVLEDFPDIKEFFKNIGDDE